MERPKAKILTGKNLGLFYFFREYTSYTIPISYRNSTKEIPHKNHCFAHMSIDVLSDRSTNSVSCIVNRKAKMQQ